MGNTLKHRNMSSDNKKCSPPPKSHHKACCPTYPRNPQIHRFPVLEDQVSWRVQYNEYQPVDYTAPSVTSQPVWADFDIRHNKEATIPQYNTLDGNIDRRSLNGEYEVIDNIPRNIVGRTGVIGRGLLGRWGPNHAADPIVTRWKVEAGNVMKHAVTMKPILQFIAIKRADGGEWALPGGMIDPGETVNATLSREFEEEAMNSLEANNETQETIRANVTNFFTDNGHQGMKSPGEDISFTLKREFGEETMNSLEADESEKEKISKQVADLFAHGKEVYCGYVDDPRNTDNAWMETVAYNFHDETGLSVGRFKLHAGDDAVGVRWTDIDSSLELYASHIDFLYQTVQLHNAHW